MLDPEARVVREQRVRTTALALRQALGDLPASRVVLEAGPRSPWLSRLLAELGHEVIVANVRQVALIARSHRKDDRIDAELLARLGRLDPELLAPVRHRGARAQQDLAVVRSRDALVRSRTQLINHVRGAGPGAPVFASPREPGKALSESAIARATAPRRAAGRAGRGLLGALAPDRHGPRPQPGRDGHPRDPAGRPLGQPGDGRALHPLRERRPRRRRRLLWGAAVNAPARCLLRLVLTVPRGRYRMPAPEAVRR